MGVHRDVSDNFARTRVFFGAAYHPEHLLSDRVATDLDLMAKAEFSVIRVGESTWSNWEPEDGRFELDRLEPVLDEADIRGISVIIGTPTYAAPPWLRRKYPETAAQRHSGASIPYGHRQDVDFTHPAFRHLAGRVIHAIVARYRDHPAVIGWQVDNEPGIELLHNPAGVVSCGSSATGLSTTSRYRYRCRSTTCSPARYSTPEPSSRSDPGMSARSSRAGESTTPHEEVGQ